MAAAKRVLLTRAWPASDGSATDEALIASLPLEPHSCTLKTALQCNCIALHLSVQGDFTSNLSAQLHSQLHCNAMG